MKTTIIIVLILITVLLFYFDHQFKKEKKQFIDSLSVAYHHGDVAGLKNILNGKKAETYLSSYELSFWKIVAGIIREDSAEINIQFEEMMKMRLSQRQKDDIAVKMLPYFVSRRDGKRCNDCKNLLKKTKRYTDVFNFAQEISKILLEQDYSGLEKYMRVLESDTKNKGIYELLISEVYYQQGDKEKAKEYARRSKYSLKSLNSRQKPLSDV